MPTMIDPGLNLEVKNFSFKTNKVMFGFDIKNSMIWFLLIIIHPSLSEPHIQGHDLYSVALLSDNVIFQPFLVTCHPESSG